MTEAMYEAGFNSSGRFYAGVMDAEQLRSMTLASLDYHPTAAD